METEEKVNEQSVDLLLSTSQNEYSNEHDRTTTIDSKAGISLPILATYFLALAQMNDYKTIIAIPISSFWSSLLPVVLFLTYTISLVLSLAALIYITYVLFPKEYYKIDPVDLYTDENLTKENINFAIRLMHLYFDAIAHNRKTNDDRIKLYQKSWLLALVSVVCFVIYIIVKNNL